MLIKGELRFIEILGMIPQINREKLQDVKEQLIRGDKYEMMWLEIVKYLNSICGNFHIAEIIKKKYFPALRFEHRSFVDGFKEGIELGMCYKDLCLKVKELLNG
ncbi:MAG: hypothetical protein E3J83_03305 [Candidatus Atribacteria bacterium]|nr:MAG: hypothetical protein E3J83_03305 [Candidatus Atribacteria bacterium]